jgi:O-antigen/teichoic acid export membrane protein
LKKLNKKLNLQQNILWNTAGMTIYLGCQWLITVLVVRLSSDFTNSGLLTLAMSITNIFYAIAAYNMRAYQVSDVEGKYKDCIYVQMRSVTSAAALLMCVLYSLIVYHDARFWGITLYMIFRVVEAFIDILQGFDQKAMRMDIIGKSMAVRGVANVAVFAVIIKLTDSFSLAVIGMIIVSMIVMGVYDIPWAGRFATLKGRFNSRTVKRLLIECLPMGIAASLSSSIVTIPRSLLDFVKGEEMLGIYGALAVPTVIVQVAATYIFNPMLSLYAVHYANKDKERFYKLFRRTMLAILILSAAALIGAYLLEDIVLPILLGASIKPYIYLFMPMLVCTILNAAVWFETNLLVVIRDFQSYFWVTVVSAVLSLAVGYPLIRAFSMNGVNITLIIVNSVQLIWFSIILFSKFRRNFSEKDEGNTENEKAM